MSRRASRSASFMDGNLSASKCSHCCLCRRRPIPSRLNNKLFNWPIGKTESQSEIVFKGQLGSVLQTPHAEYCTVQQFIGSAINRQAHFNSEKYIILRFDSIKQKNTLHQVINCTYLDPWGRVNKGVLGLRCVLGWSYDLSSFQVGLMKVS